MLVSYSSAFYLIGGEALWIFMLFSSIFLTRKKVKGGAWPYFGPVLLIHCLPGLVNRVIRFHWFFINPEIILSPLFTWIPVVTSVVILIIAVLGLPKNRPASFVIFIATIIAYSGLFRFPLFLYYPTGQIEALLLAFVAYHLVGRAPKNFMVSRFVTSFLLVLLFGVYLVDRQSSFFFCGLALASLLGLTVYKLFRPMKNHNLYLALAGIAFNLVVTMLSGLGRD